MTLGNTQSKLLIYCESLIDNYIKQRAPLVQRQLEQRGVSVPK